MSDEVIIEFKYCRRVTQVSDMKVGVSVQGLLDWCIENNENPHEMGTWVDAFLSQLIIDVEDGTATYTKATLTMPDPITGERVLMRPSMLNSKVTGEAELYVTYVFDGDEMAPHYRIREVGHSVDDLHDAVAKAE